MMYILVSDKLDKVEHIIDAVGAVDAIAQASVIIGEDIRHSNKWHVFFLVSKENVEDKELESIKLENAYRKNDD